MHAARSIGPPGCSWQNERRLTRITGPNAGATAVDNSDTANRPRRSVRSLGRSTLMARSLTLVFLLFSVLSFEDRFFDRGPRGIRGFFSCIWRVPRLHSQAQRHRRLSLCLRRESDIRFLNHEPWIAEPDHRSRRRAAPRFCREFAGWLEPLARRGSGVRPKTPNDCPHSVFV